MKLDYRSNNIDLVENQNVYFEVVSGIMYGWLEVKLAGTVNELISEAQLGGRGVWLSPCKFQDSYSLFL